MNSIYAGVSLLVILSNAPGGLPKTNFRSQRASRHQPILETSVEMQRLFKFFLGTWRVSETFEASSTRKGQRRKGIAKFRAGPGLSLIEDYRSNGSAGKLRFMGIFWWNPKLNAYQVLTCANNDGCRLRGTLRWEGGHLVNTWDEDVNGKKATFRDSFVDLLPSSFTLVSEGSAEGKTIWHVTTRYTKNKLNSVSTP
jgi:hypothetical protein